MTGLPGQAEAGGLRHGKHSSLPKRARRFPSYCGDSEMRHVCYFLFFFLVTLGKKKRKEKGRTKRTQHKQHFHTLMCDSPPTSPPLARARKTGWIVQGDRQRRREFGEQRRVSLSGRGGGHRESLSNYKVTPFPAKLQKVTTTVSLCTSAAGRHDATPVTSVPMGDTEENDKQKKTAQYVSDWVGRGEKKQQL